MGKRQAGRQAEGQAEGMQRGRTEAGRGAVLEAGRGQDRGRPRLQVKERLILKEEFLSEK